MHNLQQAFRAQEPLAPAHELARGSQAAQMQHLRENFFSQLWHAIAPALGAQNFAL